MRIVVNEPHFISNIEDRKFMLENDIWVLNYKANVSNSIDYYEDCFDKNGNNLGEFKVKSEVITEFKDAKSNHDPYIVQLNLDFVLMTVPALYRIDEVNFLTDTLSDTFGNTFFTVHKDYSIKSYDFRRIGKKYEICGVGNTRMVVNKLDKIDIKLYKKNYENALIKYPKQKSVIDILYYNNIENFK